VPSTHANPPRKGWSTNGLGIILISLGPAKQAQGLFQLRSGLVELPEFEIRVPERGPDQRLDQRTIREPLPDLSSGRVHGLGHSDFRTRLPGERLAEPGRGQDVPTQELADRLREFGLLRRPVLFRSGLSTLGESVLLGANRPFP
jgi:hypothetical protein